jgi:hypothetical protein
VEGEKTYKKALLNTHWFEKGNALGAPNGHVAKMKESDPEF